MLNISELHVTLDDTQKPILQNLNLTIPDGEVHAIMGPNGAGKSTLGHVLAGKEGYSVTQGHAWLNDTDLLSLEPHERAAAGLFLALQTPVEIPGVSMMTFLKTALDSLHKLREEQPLTTAQTLKRIKDAAKRLDIDPETLKRAVNLGCSGGEKKRNDILQMTVLDPHVCVLDETDSGLDVDSLKTVATGINALRNTQRCFLVITHYQRLLDHVQPDRVHILIDGHIVESGGPELAKTVETHGYAPFKR